MAFGMVLSNLHMAALTPSALCLWHGAFPHSARLDSTHAGLPLDACDVPAATSNHSHPAFLLVVEDVFVSFPAGYGVHVFQHGFSVHMSHLHSRKDTVSMHLHALSWFCSSLVAGC